MTQSNECTCRSPYDPTGYGRDAVDEPLYEIFHALRRAGHKIVIMTGRSAEYREAVESWLEEKGLVPDDLFMRPAGDMRNDGTIKTELFFEHIAPNYNFLGQFDDRNRVVEALRLIGVPVYQVAPGDF